MSLITVIREERTIDTIFTISVAILVSILYINFGCAMDWNVCRDTLRRPIAPAIGFFCQFLIMPLVNLFYYKYYIYIYISQIVSIYIILTIKYITFCMLFYQPDSMILILYYFQLSFLIGYFLFADNPELQIGMFFTGISPSGGASNMWTLLLDGNLNLSITMTTICTIAAFGK